MVFDVIEEKWKEDKTQPLMSIEEAADKVENYFLEKYKKAQALKKLGATKATVSETLNAVETASEPAPTLKSSLTPSSSVASQGDLTFEQRMEEAKKLLRANGFR